jgi:RNA polymerase sigma factor (sigma-70 family)
MNRRTVQTIARQLADLSADAGADRPDADLLGRFIAARDQAAFAALVRRHGPMVWASCRHLLPNPADAEDAFQATFLALAQQAKRVRNTAALGGWLHGVAVRAALKVRRSEARRKGRERASAGPEAGRPVPDSAWDGLLAAVHEEVERLPVALRTAFVLCDLEGVPQPTAAARLGWKPGTLTGRLARARQSLMARLTSRGLAPAVAAGGVGTAATGAAVPPALNQTVLMLAGDPVRASAAVTALVTEVTAMTFTKVKLLAAGLMVAGGLGLGVGSGRVANLTAQSPTAEPPAKTEPPPAAKPAPAPKAKAAPPALAATAEAGRSGWQYRYAPDVSDPVGFAGVLDKFGGEGWEYAGRWTYPASHSLDEMKQSKLDKAVTANPFKFYGVGGDYSLGVLIFKRPKPATSPAKVSTAAAAGPTPGIDIDLAFPVYERRVATESPSSGSMVAGVSPAQPARTGVRTPAPDPLILPIKHISVNDASSMVQLYLEDVKEMRVQAIGTTNTLVVFNVPPAAAARAVELLKRVDVAPAVAEERPLVPGLPPGSPGAGAGQPRGRNPFSGGKPTPSAKPVPPPPFTEERVPLIPDNP